MDGAGGDKLFETDGGATQVETTSGEDVAFQELVRI